MRPNNKTRKMKHFSKYYNETLTELEYSDFSINQLIVEMNNMETEGDLETSLFFARCLKNRGYETPSFQELNNMIDKQQSDTVNACLGKI